MIGFDLPKLITYKADDESSIKECDGDCPLCDPESYTTIVDASFLNNVKNMYNTLERIKKGYYTTKWWGEQIDKKLKELKKTNH